jgi:thioredoxin-like negative regulator of GroEL
LVAVVFAAAGCGQSEEKSPSVSATVAKTIPSRRSSASELYHEGRFAASARMNIAECAARALPEHQLMMMISRSVPVEIFAGQDSYDAKQQGVLRQARLAFAKKQYTEAILQLGAHLDDPESLALTLRALASSQQFQEFVQVLNSAPKSVQQFADYWAGLAICLNHRDASQDSIGAWLRCVFYDPTDRYAYQQLRRLLDETGDKETAKLAGQRDQQLSKTQQLARLCAGDSAMVRYRVKMAEALIDMGRPLEALSWRMAALTLANGTPEARLEIDNQRRAIVSMHDLEASRSQYALLLLDYQ